MKASIEWLCEKDAIIRIHPDESPGGDPFVAVGPYNWCCTAVRGTGNKITLKGMDQLPVVSQARALGVLFKKLGLSPHWERRFTNLDRETGFTVR